MDRRTMGVAVALVAVVVGAACASARSPAPVTRTPSPKTRARSPGAASPCVSSPSSSPGGDVPVAPVVPSSGLAFTRFETPSMESPHASRTRSGRVAVAPHPCMGLTAVGPIDNGPSNTHPPRFIDVPPRVGMLVIERPCRGVESNGYYDVRFMDGGTSAFPGVLYGGHVLVREEAIYTAGVVTSWSGVASERSPYITVGRVESSWRAACEARRCETSGWSHLIGRRMHRTAGKPSGPTGVARTGGSDLYGQGLGLWSVGIWRRSNDEGGHAVLASRSGRFVVLLPQGDATTRHGIPALDAPIDPGATDLSIVPPFALILYGGGDAGQYIKSVSEDLTTTRIDARLPDGSLAWRASLPFLAGQPAIDGNGRVYVVGTGIAALDLRGHVLWSAASSVPMRATAFADGTLAVVRGSALRSSRATAGSSSSFWPPRSSRRIPQSGPMAPSGGVGEDALRGEVGGRPGRGGLCSGPGSRSVGCCTDRSVRGGPKDDGSGGGPGRGRGQAGCASARSPAPVDVVPVAEVKSSSPTAPSPCVSSPSPRPGGDVPMAPVVPSSGLSFTRFETPSMEFPHASSTRSGRGRRRASHLHGAHGRGAHRQRPLERLSASLHRHSAAGRHAGHRAAW